MERVEFIVEPPDTYPGFPFNEYLKLNKLKFIYKKLEKYVVHRYAIQIFVDCAKLIKTINIIASALILHA